ncbi:MAG: hypothetical protein EAZ08_02225 [Cytophagales bacterium]|nr:MAG: hypothetical protein EAZ08_02225 [Cytophagales bacterium]
MRYVFAFTCFLLLSHFPAFSQNENIWEFVNWEMKLKQVQDSLHERQIDYSYSLNDGKGAFIKVSIADYQGWSVDFLFSMSSQLLYQISTKKKFAQTDVEKGEKELAKVSEYLRETWGAPLKEMEDKTAPFCQYEYVWGVGNTKITATYCKTSTISLSVVYLKK